ncbi:MAG: ATP-binding protein [Gemmatimonadaceae bacterium]
MLTTRLGEDQRFVTRTLRLVIAALLVLAVDAIYDVVVERSVLVWIELGVLLIAIVLIEVVLRRQATIESLTRAQRQLNAELRASEAKFSGILAIAADAIIVVDDTQTIMHFNHGAETIFGYSDDEVVGQKLSLLLPPRYRATHQGHVNAFAASGESARRMGHRRAVSGLRKDGTEFPAEAAISKLQAADARPIFSVVLRDITEQKFAEDAERFIAHSIGQMTGSLDEITVAQRVVEDAVPMLADACVIEIGESPGTHKFCHAADDRVRSALISLAEEYDENESNLFGATDTAHASVVTPPEPIEMLSIADACTNADVRDLWNAVAPKSRLTFPLTVGGRTIGHLAFFDLGTRVDRFRAHVRPFVEEFTRSATLAIDNSQHYSEARRATRVRDEVLALVSHDLRNPLGAIAMCARIMREAPTNDRAEMDRMVSAIAESAVWMQRLIRDLLDVTSIEAGHLSVDRQPAVASLLVNSAVGLLRAELATKSLNIVVDVQDDLPTIIVDGNRIVQVLSNLIGNAVKFTPTGGQISLTVSETDEGVLFAVADNGIGIAREMQSMIFNRFWQERPAGQNGHGLGLAISRGIVEGHGGKLWVDSELGKGSVFKFLIPMDHAPTLVSVAGV